MLNKINSITPKYTSFRAEDSSQEKVVQNTSEANKAEQAEVQSIMPNMPDKDTFDKMVDEQQKAMKKQEKDRKVSMTMSVLVTTAFLGIAGVTLYPFAKNLLENKSIFTKITEDIPDYKDNCVNKTVKKIVDERLSVLEKPKEVLEHLGLKKEAQMYLFFGPTGTSKSYSAKIIAKALDAEYTEVQFSELSSKWVGETAVNITKKWKYFHKLAKKNPDKHYVITFNEIDSLINNVSRLGENNEHLGQNRTAYLNGLDLMKDCPNVTIIGTTNINPRSAKLDPATLGRFGIIEEFKRPELEEADACLAFILKKYPAAKDLLNNKEERLKIAQKIVDKKGTQRDIANIVEEAMYEFGKGVTDTNTQLTSDIVYKAIDTKKIWAAAIDEDAAAAGIDLGAMPPDLLARVLAFISSLGWKPGA